MKKIVFLLGCIVVSLLALSCTNDYNNLPLVNNISSQKLIDPNVEEVKTPEKSSKVSGENVLILAR